MPVAVGIGRGCGNDERSSHARFGLTLRYNRHLWTGIVGIRRPRLWRKRIGARGSPMRRSGLRPISDWNRILSATEGRCRDSGD